MQAADRGWTGRHRVTNTLDTRNVSDRPHLARDSAYTDNSRFLLRSQRWPFVSFSRSHHDIAFACVSQVMQTLDLASNDMPSSALTERVGLGLLGLQEYAHEYWPIHVLRYFDAIDEPVDQRSPLLTQLSRFAAKHKDLLARIQPNTLPGPSDSTKSPNQDKIPEKLQVLPELCMLICQILDFRHDFDAKQASEGPGKSIPCG